MARGPTHPLQQLHRRADVVEHAERHGHVVGIDLGDLFPSPLLHVDEVGEQRRLLLGQLATMASAGSMPVTWMPAAASGANSGPLPHPTSSTRFAPTATDVSTAIRSRSNSGPRPSTLATGSLE